MTYSIKDVAAKTNLSIYTLRYYDQQGLLPFVARNAAGYRVFTDSDLHLLKTICCLKNTGMKIADIRTYIEAVMQGPATIPQRRALLQAHRDRILAAQREVMANLKGVDEKIAIYADPHATDLVEQERAAAKADKIANGLPNPF
ncbi:MerR family transcriptional regulator [Lactiplantibacillus fabifermentans T30PCM01]|uniref:MerR family transcriptional regulator n=1 Tax=Lactiplantibacillus fabifermentans T30PCM01 TaxID=1400520 RepID=W6T8E6_9LACO|nr:MerR family transcriptional regulator [Lactiplantibacillus fabifermentans]ETY74637.1 MerR family transcriptional regulator [Lactiplantibacillus fabifermentans T30PCM01]